MWVSQHALQVSPGGYPRMPCRSDPEGGLVPRGVSNFGRSPIFWGVSNFSGGAVWNTVNVRPVRILLECILVALKFSHVIYNMYLSIIFILSQSVSGWFRISWDVFSVIHKVNTPSILAPGITNFRPPGI